MGGMILGYVWLVIGSLMIIFESLILSVEYEEETEKSDDDKDGGDDSGEQLGFFRMFRVLGMIAPLVCIVTAIVGFTGLKRRNASKLIFAQKGLMLLFFFKIVDVVTSLINGGQTNFMSVTIDVVSLVILSRMMQTNKLLCHILL